MPAPRRRVLVDATALLGGSMLHGIGRYIYDILQGLTLTRDEWSPHFTIEAISDLRWLGRADVSSDLVAVAEAARAGTRRPDGPINTRRWATLGKVARDRGADVVHITQPIGVPLRLPLPTVVTCYDLIPLRYPKEYLGTETKRVLRWARDWHRYRTPTRVACISAKTGTELSLLDVPTDRIDVIVTGIDLAQWSSPPLDDDLERRTRLGVGAKRYLLYVGDCDYRKNVRGMFESLAIARRDADIELVWAGHLLATKRAAMEDLARVHGVRDAVKFLGFVADADLLPLYRGALGLLFISRLEGFGLPVAEAMAAGCPTIVARSSGCDEVAGDAGLVVDADDPSETAGAILRIFRSKDECAELVRRGRARVGLFDRREMARAYVRSYERALRPQAKGAETSVFESADRRPT